MSALTRYPVPRAVAAGAVNKPRLFFRLEPTIVPEPVLQFLQPLRATKQGIPAGAVDRSQLYFSLESTVVPDPVLQFLQPLRGLEVVKAGAVDDPRLYFRREARALDNSAKRQAVLGVARPWMRGQLPFVGKGRAWRSSVALSYPVADFQAPPASLTERINLPLIGVG